VIAPAVAAAAAGRRLAMPLAGLWWQDTLGGPVPLSVPAPGDAPADPGPGPGSPADLGTPTDPGWLAGPDAGPGSPAGPECRRVLEEVVTPLTEAIAGLVPVSPRVLWGNVASAVNSAALQVAAGRPGLSDRAWAVASALLASPRLSGETRRPGPAFRRQSCCLIYKIAPGRARSAGGVCGDCVLSGARVRPRAG
jgi:hypothetical protein